MCLIDKKIEVIFGLWKCLKIGISWQFRCFKYLYATKKIHKYINILYIQLNNKDTDPYWDPPTAQLLGITFLSM